MATRQTAHLPTGMTLLDFATPTRIMQAFGGDMKAMRAEYSRQRSIIRKRVERMEQKGEIYNKFYNYYGDLQKAAPSARGLSDKTIMNYLMSTAQALGGGYKSTIDDVAASRKDAVMSMLQQAALADDREYVFSLLDPDLSAEQKEKDFNLLKEGKSGQIKKKDIREISPEQYAKAWRMVGMIQKISLVNAPYNVLFNDAMKTVLHESSKGKPKGLLSMTAELMHKMSIQLEDEELGVEEVSKESALNSLKKVYNNQGRQKVSYKKAHKKRGK